MKAVYKWGMVGGIVVVGAGIVYYATGTDTTAYQFNTVKVMSGDYVTKVQATGTLEPQELVDVGAQVTGEIKEFGTDLDGKRIDYGSEVKAGQMLALIDDTIVELDIQRAEAQVAQAKAQIKSAEAAIASAKAKISQAKSDLNKATRDMDRAEKLGVGEALSQMSFDQYVNAEENARASMESADAQLLTAEAQLKNAQAQLLSAEAQLKSELRNRDYTRICTPVDGTIVVRQVNVGQTVVSNMNATTLFLVARDLSKMQIWTSVNEVDIAKIKPGQEVRYTVDALPNMNFIGKVNKIRPNATMTSNVVTYIVEVDIENPDRKLLPYMSANAEFIVEKQEGVLMVPDAVFAFKPEPEMLSAELRAERGGKAASGARTSETAGDASAMKPAVVWRKVTETTVAPLRVLRGKSNGARSIVKAEDESVDLTRVELVTGVSKMVTGETASSPGSNNLFGPTQRPKRRERGTGESTGGAGSQKQGAQKQNGGNEPPPPPM